MFDYDWFFSNALEEQREQCRARCAFLAFPDLSAEEAFENEAFRRYMDELESRLLIYLRDGAIYEVKDFVEVRSKAHLTFECEPAEDRYRVGCFVVSVPFEEIVRVEIYSVHPSRRPQEPAIITGFKHPPDVQGAGAARD